MGPACAFQTKVGRVVSTFQLADGYSGARTARHESVKHDREEYISEKEVDESQIDSRRRPFLRRCVEFGKVDTRADRRVAMGGASDERYGMLVSVSTRKT
jgi:hypothetical protein